MTENVVDVLGVLKARLTTLQGQQRSKPWTQPEHNKSLVSLGANVAAVGATFGFTLKTGPAVAKPATKTDALTLGVGVSSKTSAALKAGVSLGVGFSTHASVQAALVVDLHACISLTADLTTAFGAYNAQASTMAGSNGVLPPGRRPDSSEVDAAIRALNAKVATAQQRASALAPPATKSPLTGEIRMARVGVWHADLASDDEKTLTGKVRFKVDELIFVGTVLPAKSGLDGSRARCHVVGGNGGLSKPVTGKSYTGSGGVKVGTVVRDILHDCGEDLSDLSDGPTLDRKLARWHVASGPANEALNDLAQAVDGSWRVLRDGTVWFGVELWPEVKPDHIVVDEDWSSGTVTIAPETADMVPGVVYDGHKIEYVVHQLDERLRTEIRTDHPRAALDRYMAGQRRGVDYSREWPCTVVLQNSDGTLQLLPDDDAMQARGLDKVPIRYGMPGFTAEVKAGARCHLAFAAGDPSRPFAHNWEPDSATLVTLTFVGGTRAGARIGDLVQSGGAGTIVTMTPVAALLPGPLAPCLGIGLPYMISFSAIPPTPVSAAPLYGAVVTGQERDRS